MLKQFSNVKERIPSVQMCVSILTARVEILIGVECYELTVIALEK